MLFVVDIGNTHTVTGVYDNDKLIGQWRLKSDHQRTSDEIAIRHYALFKMVGIDPAAIKNIIISSVVPSLQASWFNCFEKYFSKNLDAPPFIVNNSTVKDFITVRIDTPNEIGADRLVNSIAAHRICQSNSIVIDFGTAITFDCVTHDCTYRGGVILPGIKLGLEALVNKTAKLPQVDITTPPVKTIGTNTVEAMKSGILIGYGVMVDGLIDKIEMEMTREAGSCTIIATGGMAEIISKYAQKINIVDPLLTLEGLRIIHSLTGHTQ